MHEYVRTGASVICAFCLCLGLLCGCSAPAQELGSAGVQVTLAGSTSVQPFVELLEEHYSAENPQAPPINVQGGGSTAGVQAAASGIADIGMSSRELREKELALGLHALPVARDAIAVIVHPTNSLAGLTSEQVRDVFSGRIGDWSELGGRRARIVVVTREEGSGTRGAFEDLVMADTPIAAGALRQDSNGSVRVIVAGHPDAIGYISLGIVDQRVKALRLDEVTSTTDSVVSGEYVLARPFLFLWKTEPPRAAKEFVDFVLGADGQELLVSEGLVSVEEP